MAAAPAGAAFFPDSPFSSRSAGTTGAAFLKIPNGARYEAMGGASVAAAEGAEALFWNPAGLARLQAESPSELTLSYGALLESTYAGAAGYARPGVGPGTLGGGLVYFSQAAQTAYTNVGDPSGTFKPSDMAGGAAYAARLGSRVLLGAGLKFIRSSIAEASGTTAAVDAGVQVQHVSDVGEGPLDLGASVSNLGPPIKVGSAASPLPFSLRGGALWHASPKFNAVLDLVLPADQDLYVALGGEGLLKQPSWTAALRMGFNQSRTRSIDGLAGLTAGLGLDFKRFRLDYAWAGYGDLGMVNRVTLAFRF